MATTTDTENRSPTTRTMAMPADTNPSGDIFGGWVLSQMDIAAGICAGQRAQCRVVTAAIDGMHFYRPVKVGDILGVYTSITRIGRSSMDILVEAWVRRDRIGVREKVTDATFTFVAVDDDGQSVPIPAKEDIPEYVKEKFGDM
jgi:acyl-CoA thioesterase YciA